MKKIRLFLAISVPAVCIIGVWYKILTTPDAPYPLLQGLGYTLVMLLLAWFALGMPKPQKQKTIDEIVEHLISVGFVSKYLEQNNGAQKGFAYEKNGVVFEFFTFDSSSDASKFYNRKSAEMDNPENYTIYSQNMNSSNYKKHALKTEKNYDCVISKDSTVIHISSDTENAGLAEKILKDIRY